MRALRSGAHSGPSDASGSGEGRAPERSPARMARQRADAAVGRCSQGQATPRPRHRCRDIHRPSWRRCQTDDNSHPVGPARRAGLVTCILALSTGRWQLTRKPAHFLSVAIYLSGWIDGLSGWIDGHAAETKSAGPQNASRRKAARSGRNWSPGLLRPGDTKSTTRPPTRQPCSPLASSVSRACPRATSSQWRRGRARSRGSAHHGAARLMRGPG